MARYFHLFLIGLREEHYDDTGITNWFRTKAGHSIERLAFLFSYCPRLVRRKSVFVGGYRNALIHCISMLVQYCESFLRRIINLVDAGAILRFCLRHETKGPTTEERTSYVLWPPRILAAARRPQHACQGFQPVDPTKGARPCWEPALMRGAEVSHER